MSLTPFILIDAYPQEVPLDLAQFKRIGAYVTSPELMLNKRATDLTFNELSEYLMQGAMTAWEDSQPVVMLGGPRLINLTKHDDQPRLAAIWEATFRRLMWRFGCLWLKPNHAAQLPIINPWDMLIQAAAVRRSIPAWSLNPGISSFSNAHDAATILVGDRENHPASAAARLPFHAVNRSSEWLTRALMLAQAAGASRSLGLVNVNDSDGPMVINLLRDAKPRNFIALGREAQRGLKRLGIVADEVVNHPSWERRFQWSQLEVYADTLRQVIGS